MTLRPAVLLAATPLIALLASCASPPTPQSSWRDRQVLIDGRDGEWEGAKYYVEQSNVDIGVLNDGEYLYLCMSAVERPTMMQVLGHGMTTWLNAKGNRDRSFGVRYPNGRTEDMAMPRPTGGRGGMRPGRRAEGGEPLDPRQLEAYVERALEGQAPEMLHDGDDEGRRLGLADSEVVEVRMGFDRGRLIYELKVRLARTEPHGPGIGAVEGKRVGVGLITPELTPGGMGGRRGGMAGGMGGSGIPGAGMPPGGGVRGTMSRPPGGSIGPVPLEVWFQVELARPGEVVAPAVH